MGDCRKRNVGFPTFIWEGWGLSHLQLPSAMVACPVRVRQMEGNEDEVQHKETGVEAKPNSRDPEEEPPATPPARDLGY